MRFTVIYSVVKQHKTIMKKTLLSSLILLFISYSSFSQQQTDLVESRMDQGFPEEIGFIKDQINLIDVTQTELNTQIDSLNVKFGGFTQGTNEGYWIALLNKKDLLAFKTIHPSDSQMVGVYDTVIVKYDNSSKMISVFIDYQKGSDKVLYSWLDGDEPSKMMVIETIEKPIEVGKTLPNFQITSLSGNSINTDDFRGKYLVINWWATSCGPCIGEMSGLNKLFEKYESDDRIKFLAIAWDSVDKVERLLTKKEFKYQQTLASSEVANILGESFPKHIIVDPNGIVSFYKEGGSLTVHEVLDEYLKKQLN